MAVRQLLHQRRNPIRPQFKAIAMNHHMAKSWVRWALLICA